MYLVGFLSFFTRETTFVTCLKGKIFFFWSRPFSDKTILTITSPESVLVPLNPLYTE